MKRVGTFAGALLAATTIMLVSAAEAAHPGRNGLIAFVADDAIYTIYPDGSHKQKLVPQQSTYRLGAVAHPTWSPDGKRIAFMAVRTLLSGGEPEINLFVMNADGSNARSVAPAASTTDFSTGSGSLSWSPDGSEIAYTRSFLAYGTPVRQVSVAKVDGHAGRNLGLLGDTWDPAWSPNGRTIVFGTPFGLDAVDSDGYNRRRLISEVRPARPDWSPDGTRLLFDNLQVPYGTGTVYTANADGSGLRAVNEAETAYAAAWSPDGTTIVATVQGAEFRESVKYLRQGETARALGRTPVLGAMPDWQPCGQGARCPVMTPCVVPRVIGFSLTRARTAIRRAGCTLGTVRRPRHVALARTVVARQSPRPRARVPHDTKVSLVLRRRR